MLTLMVMSILSTGVYQEIKFNAENLEVLQKNIPTFISKILCQVQTYDSASKCAQFTMETPLKTLIAMKVAVTTMPSTLLTELSHQTQQIRPQPTPCWDTEPQQL